MEPICSFCDEDGYMVFTHTEVLFLCPKCVKKYGTDTTP